jgi:DNA mismatch endonuclease (patch repair protein)
MARDPAVTSKIMAAVRSRDTRPELALRRELHRRGLRYRLKSKLAGRPDIVFVGARVAVFVDGDFWHGFGWRERGFSSWEEQFESHADPERWRAKIGRNIERDKEVSQLLEEQGWLVVRVLESRIKTQLERCGDDIERVVRDRAR